MMAKWLSGLAVAWALVASPSRKPTVTVRLQPAVTMARRFGSKSLLVLDSAWLTLMPRSFSAFFSPS